jgi:two-component system nitrogen regulation sensor histidine kinase GlnL
MTLPRPPTVLALAAAGAVAGATAVILGAWGDRHAEAAQLEASSRAVARVRELDQVFLHMDRCPAQPDRALASIEALTSAGASGDVAAALQGLRSCIAGEKRICPRGLEAEVAAVRRELERELERQWREQDQRRDRAHLAASAGFAALLAAVVLALVWSWRAWRTLAAPAGGAASSAEPRMAEVEALLKKRTEQLYAAQLSSWEKERFAIFGEIAAGLSHGLKTPLAGVRAAAQLAQAKLPPDHPVVAQLDDIIAEVDTLVEQIRRFLQASGTGAPMPRAVPVAEVVAALSDEYRPAARERQVLWQAETAPDTGAVFVDPALLTMALRNLIENALAVAPTGTSVTVVASPTATPSGMVADGEAPLPSAWVEICVSDQGPGIPSAVLAGGTGLSTKAQGSGLGLALAQRIVNRHGGVLRCEAGERGGTRARVILPQAAPGRETPS